MPTQRDLFNTATPGPYRYNPSQGAVFTLAPGVLDLHTDDTEHYGGPMICESIANAADGYQIVAAPEMRRVLELVLLFHGAEWDTEGAGTSQARWEALGGGTHATSKALCDRARVALAVANGEAESTFGLQTVGE